MANVLGNIFNKIKGGIDTLADAAVRKTASIGSNIGSTVGSTKGRLRNTNPLISSATGNQRTFTERQAVHYNKTLFDDVMDPKSTSRFVDAETAARIEERGGNIFRTNGWGPAGKGSKAYYSGEEAFVTMGNDDAAAFIGRVQKAQPRRSEGFWDFILGRNQRRLKPDDEIERIIEQEKNRLVNVPTKAETDAARKTIKTTLGQDRSGIEATAAEPVRKPLGAQAKGGRGRRRNREFLNNANRGVRKINAPINPDKFYNRVPTGRVWASRGIWAGAGIAGVGISGSMIQSSQAGKAEQLSNRNPSMFTGQGVQGRRF